ncbi:MAG: hypothetical protein LBR81_10170 [Prevotellaceae bacterium]|jgi:hypothetical protein|nr:hypothetical protein [Prevotellaceae bacterium]
MKSISIILLSCLMLLSLSLFGQTETNSINLSDLEVPTSPAFMLLDNTPVSIENPVSSKALVLSVLDAINTGNGFPKDYAVEFTPFWFFEHPDMTAYKYFGFRSDTTDKQNVWKDLPRASFSFAFTSGESSIENQEISINDIAVGGRTKILSIRSKNDIEEYKSILGSIEDSLTSQLIEMNKIKDPSLKKAMLNKYAKNPNFLKLKEDLNNILNRRPIFSLDAAVGYNHFFLDNNFNDSHFGRFGAWLTGNYSQAVNKKSRSLHYLNFYAVGRYFSDGTVWENNGFVRKDFFDAGGKMEYEQGKFSFAGEYIYRFNDDIGKSYRCVGIVKYKLMEQVYLTCSFGKNFGTSDNLISFLGLNWGISSGKEQVQLK